MPRTRPFQELIDRMSPERRQRIEEEARKLIEEYRWQQATLTELRHARSLTQVKLAERLGVAQSEVSRIEQRTDMYVSTLRDVVEAMGGKLELRAVFPEGSVEIAQFADQ